MLADIPGKIIELEEEITEIHCHNCDGYIRFALNKNQNGYHVLSCPKCGHEHCRVIKDGKVTDERWDNRNNGQQQLNGVSVYYYQMTMNNYATTGYQSVANNNSSNDVYLRGAWLNTTSSAIFYTT